MRLNIFTIVLNGHPYISEIRETLRTLGAFGVDWQWTIVHGYAEPVKDTAWCKPLAELPPDDGTKALARMWANTDPRIRFLSQDRWPGKTAMCNAALATFDAPGVLVQMDADEIWTPTQLRALPALFARYPQADAAMFLCRYWVGPRRFILTPGAWGNNPAYEWIRAWRFKPGQTFEAHEPPQLSGVRSYISPAATSQQGLVFDHYAYATREQVAFKEKYYGYAGAVAAWEKLQAMRGPVDLHGVLPWVPASVMSYEA